MLLYMSSKYLFLGDAQRDKTVTTGGVWQNLPSLSQSTRECYLSLSEFKLDYADGGTSNGQGLIIKMELPVLNYFSSDNTNVVIGFLEEDTSNEYKFSKENKIHLLTNDNLKKVKIIVTDLEGGIVDVPSTASINLVFKLEYVDQDKQTESYLLEIPKHLGGL
jgi:hypothetical protein